MTFKLLLGLLLSAPATQPGAFLNSTQMMVVTTSDWNAVDGKLQRYQRAASHDAWQAVGQPIAIVVGVHGMGWGVGVEAAGAGGPVKKEGDGKSPAGVFLLGTAFGDASQPLAGLKLSYLALTPTIECVDDPASKHYNRLVDRSSTAVDWKSSEHMRDVGEPYRWGVVITHNARKPVPGSGSCVFLHIWSGPAHGTAGCTAMSQSDLETLMTWLDPARKPLLVQLPKPQYARLTRRWQLPQP